MTDTTQKQRAKRIGQRMPDRETMRKKIEADPDDVECEAGIDHPEAPGAKQEQRAVARAIAKAGGFDYERGQTSIVMDNYAEAAIAAYKAHLEAEGMVVVPREPTGDIVEAMQGCNWNPAKWRAANDSIKQE